MNQTDTEPSWADRYEAMRRNRGEAARQITEEHFEDMLGVLPPANWTNNGVLESFMVDEAETEDLYTWCACLTEDDRETFWEMVAPSDSTPSEIMAKIYTAQRLAA